MYLHRLEHDGVGGSDGVKVVCHAPRLHTDVNGQVRAGCQGGKLSQGLEGHHSVLFSQEQGQVSLWKTGAMDSWDNSKIKDSCLWWADTAFGYFDA